MTKREKLVKLRDALKLRPEPFWGVFDLVFPEAKNSSVEDTVALINLSGISADDIRKIACERTCDGKYDHLDRLIEECKDEPVQTEPQSKQEPIDGLFLVHFANITRDILTNPEIGIQDKISFLEKFNHTFELYLRFVCR